MINPSHKPSRMLILLVAMAVLLPVLAGLQYYWLGEVSKGATESLHSTLAAGAHSFRQDFNREFIRAYLNFQIDLSSPPTNLDQYHIQSVERWISTAPYPKLLSDVFFISYDETNRPHALRVNIHTKQLESVDLAPEGETLHRRFLKSGLPLDSFDEELLALIVPIPNLKTDQADSPASTRSYTVAMLNVDYLKQEFIPALIRRHFADNFNEYNFGVISFRHPDRVIYSSSKAETGFSSSDVTTRIFGIEADEFQSFVRSEFNALNQGNSRTLRLNIRFLKMPSAATQEGRWQFAIKHQAGSLAAAINSIRRRNLALSFGILLLLTLAIVLTATSMGRAQRLAAQQMNFIAGVTHELRTPLAVICSAGENLADGVVDNPAKVADYGKVIHEEGRRLTDMVEQVLEFAGAQSGRRRYQFRSVPVAQLLEEALSASDSQLKRERVEVEKAIAPDLYVNGDPSALMQAVQNLISNAIKYGGKTGWLRIGANASDNGVLISVEDRGIGINKADINHIFEPFYRGREAVANQIAGTGVGLSIVKQIVEAHGGSISVKSSMGAGTAFMLHFPQAKEASGLSPLTASPPTRV